MKETNHAAMRYAPELTQAMEAELLAAGFTALKDADSVADFLVNNEDFLLVINSVCGCAAANARPGVISALEDETLRKLPKATVFAGVDHEATAKARELLGKYEPSSPNVVLVKGGKPEIILHRHDLVHKTPEEIAQDLVARS